MKNCSKCGAELREGEAFCPVCGFSENDGAPAQDGKKKVNLFGLIGFVAGILAAAIIWWEIVYAIAPAVIGVLFSIIGLIFRKKYRCVWLAIVGLICGVLALLAMLAVVVVILLVLKSLG